MVGMNLRARRGPLDSTPSTFASAPANQPDNCCQSGFTSATVRPSPLCASPPPDPKRHLSPPARDQLEAQETATPSQKPPRCPGSPLLNPGRLANSLPRGQCRNGQSVQQPEEEHWRATKRRQQQGEGRGRRAPAGRAMPWVATHGFPIPWLLRCNAPAPSAMRPFAGWLPGTNQPHAATTPVFAIFHNPLPDSISITIFFQSPRLDVSQGLEDAVCRRSRSPTPSAPSFFLQETLPGAPLRLVRLRMVWLP